jgi:hypothetical protein
VKEVNYESANAGDCGGRCSLCTGATHDPSQTKGVAAEWTGALALRDIEGDQAYDGQQDFLAVAARVAREGRLSRFVYVSKKLG